MDRGGCRGASERHVLRDAADVMRTTTDEHNVFIIYGNFRDDDNSFESISILRSWFDGMEKNILMFNDFNKWLSIVCFYFRCFNGEMEIASPIDHIYIDEKIRLERRVIEARQMQRDSVVMFLIAADHNH